MSKKCFSSAEKSVLVEAASYYLSDATLGYESGGDGEIPGLRRGTKKEKALRRAISKVMNQ